MTNFVSWPRERDKLRADLELPNAPILKF